MSELRTRFAVSTTNRPLPPPDACQAVVNGGPTGGLTGAPNAGDAPTGTTTLTETISTATHTPTILRGNFVTIRHSRWVGRNVRSICSSLRDVNTYIRPFISTRHGHVRIFRSS